MCGLGSHLHSPEISVDEEFTLGGLTLIVSRFCIPFKPLFADRYMFLTAGWVFVFIECRRASLPFCKGLREKTPNKRNLGP